MIKQRLNLEIPSDYDLPWLREFKRRNAAGWISIAYNDMQNQDFLGAPQLQADQMHYWSTCTR